MSEEKKKDPKGDPNVRPYDNAFMQLKLKSMMPRHSSQLVVACTILVAVIFIPIGVAVVLASDQIWEKEIRYDHVKQCTINQNDNIQNISGSEQGCQVRLSFNIDQTISQPVYMYYRIKGMHQNYRDYVDSISQNQLAGHHEPVGEMAKCWPFVRPTTYPGDSGEVVNTTEVENLPLSEMYYNPAGSIAWSMFNDTFALYKNDANVAISQTGALPASLTTGGLICDGSKFGTDNNPQTGAGSCTKKGIAQPVDTDSRFKAPKVKAEAWTHAGKSGATNEFLANGWYNGEPGHKLPLATDEDFMIWARTAAMPDFRKLYRRIDTDLTAGDYVVDIQEYYDTSSFDGEKYIVLATTAWIGGNNKVLGALFLAFGCLSFVLALVFFLVALVKKPTTESNE